MATALVLLADGFEEIEAVTIRLAIRSRLRIGRLSCLEIISAELFGVRNEVTARVGHT